MSEEGFGARGKSLSPRGVDILLSRFLSPNHKPSQDWLHPLTSIEEERKKNGEKRNNKKAKKKKFLRFLEG